MTLSIERRAALWGGRTAVVDVSEEELYAPAATVHEDRVTYAELADLVRDAAAALADHGVADGDVVCVCTRNRVAVFVLLFACRRLGATLAPISHRLTPATVDRPLELLEPALVVHERGQRDLVRDVAPSRSAALDDLHGPDGAGRERSAGVMAEDPERGSDGGNRSALLALHGEGGTPIARFDAAAIEWNCVTAAATWGLGRNDRTLVLRPLSSYDGLLRLALPLLYVGGTLGIDRAFDPDDALAAIRRERTTIVAGRSTEFRELIERGDADESLASVGRLVAEDAADEELRLALADRGVSLARAYGRLECPNALAVASDAVDGADGTGAPDVGPDFAGAPVLDCAVRLVDGDEVVSGSGEGVLQLSGPVLASGYVDGDRTAEGEEGAAARPSDRTASAAEADDDAGSPPDPEMDEPSTAAATGADRPGRFVDGWFDTGARFRRDEAGRYHRVGSEE